MHSHVLSFNISFSPDTQQGPDKLTQVLLSRVPRWSQPAGDLGSAWRMHKPCASCMNCVTDEMTMPYIHKGKTPSFSVPQMIEIDGFPIHQSDLLILGSWKMTLEDKH